jgi:hypothetical protein
MVAIEKCLCCLHNCTQGESDTMRDTRRFFDAGQHGNYYMLGVVPPASLLVISRVYIKPIEV